MFYDGWVLGSYLAFIFRRVEKFVCLDLESSFCGTFLLFFTERRLGLRQQL